MTAARDFADPRIPNRDECVLRYLLDRWDRERPDKIHIVFGDGESWSDVVTRSYASETARSIFPIFDPTTRVAPNAIANSSPRVAP